MKEKLKCLNCDTIVSSLSMQDHVSCKCGDLVICAGNGHVCIYAKDVLKVDWIEEDASNVIQVDKQEEHNACEGNVKGSITRQELLNELETWISNVSSLTPTALISPVSHYDLASLAMLISAILKAS